MIDKSDLIIPESFLKTAPKVDEKTRDEARTFYRYADAYREKFGEGYGYGPTGPAPSRSEMIEDIKECLRTGKRSKKPWMNVDYKPGCYY